MVILRKKGNNSSWVWLPIISKSWASLCKFMPTIIIKRKHSIPIHYSVDNSSSDSMNPSPVGLRWEWGQCPWQTSCLFGWAVTSCHMAAARWILLTGATGFLQWNMEEAKCDSTRFHTAESSQSSLPHWAISWIPHWSTFKCLAFKKITLFASIMLLKCFEKSHKLEKVQVNYQYLKTVCETVLDQGVGLMN